VRHPYIEKQGKQERIFFREMKHLNEEHLQKRDQFRYQLQSLVESGIESGEFRKDLRADITTLTILGAANWSYQWFNPHGELNDFTVAKLMVDIVLKGIDQS
jgi:hypothetical protein